MDVIIDFDSIVQSFKINKFAILAELNKQIGQKFYTYPRRQPNSIIIDGLITTNQQLRTIIDSITAAFDKQYKIIFRLVYWNEDRESCLHNDEGRREFSSEVSIRNLPYEKPDFQKFPELPQNRITFMKVIKKSSTINWISDLLRRLKYNHDNTEYYIERVVDSMQLTSESWSLGGTWCSWDDASGEVEAEDPLEFEVFDKILETVCPNLSFLSYGKLRDECCSIVKESEYDYYGGGTTNAHHVCDLQELYDSLKEMGFLSEK